jgi:mannosyltransferase OCH1-like enzyme
MLKQILIVIIYTVIILIFLKHNSIEKLPYISFKYITTNKNIIPKIIHRTWNKRYVDFSMFKNCHKLWLDKNSAYTQSWSTDYNMRTFLEEFGELYLHTYNKLKPGAYKADLWRVCILYKYGGIYTDGHCIPYKSLDFILQKCIPENAKHKLISVLDPIQSGGGIHNGFIACTPKHPVLKQYINDILYNVKHNLYKDNPLSVTGPLCFANSLRKINGKSLQFKPGFNDAIYPFYLLKLNWGINQYIYKDDVIVMSKKYSTTKYLQDKITNKSGYTKLWKGKNIYN